MLVFLFLLVWSGRTVMFQLSGFHRAATRATARRQSPQLWGAYVRIIWQFPKISSRNIDPKYWGSCFEDTQKQDPPIYGNSHRGCDREGGVCGMCWLVCPMQVTQVWIWLGPQLLLASGDMPGFCSGLNHYQHCGPDLLRWLYY